MGTVFQFNQKRIFSLEEARSVLPIIQKITEEASQKVRSSLALLEAVKDRDAARAKDLEATVNAAVSGWQAKVEKLGAEAKGIWLVDFDCGTGYYCWKYPENNLEHFHAYSEGFQSRVKIPSQPQANPDPMVGA